jgi:tetratricopeptide (TPR) repeat protein
MRQSELMYLAKTGFFVMLCLGGAAPLAIREIHLNQANIAVNRALKAAEAEVVCGHWRTLASHQNELAHVRSEWGLANATWPKAVGRFRQTALLSLAVGDWPNAQDVLHNANDPISLLRSAWLAADEGRFEDAANQLRNISTDPLPVVLHDAWVAYGHGQYVESLICFEVAVRLDLTDSDALFGRARVRQALGQHALAIADFDQASLRCPSCGQIYLYRAFSRSISGQADEDVEQDLVRAVTVEPNNFVVIFHWGDWLRGHGRFSEAELQFQKAAQLSPGSLDPILGLVAVYCASGQREKAIPLLNAVQAHFTSPVDIEQIRVQRQACQ